MTDTDKHSCLHLITAVKSVSTVQALVNVEFNDGFLALPVKIERAEKSLP